MIRMKYLLFIGLLSCSGIGGAAMQKTIFSADVVASACHIMVNADNFDNSGRLTFGTYRKSMSMSVPSRDFSVQLYESGATVAGCSAFKVGSVVTLNFGNQGQLDEHGIVIHGDGDGIRMDVRALDSQSDYQGRLTINNHVVNYPSEFAMKGLFRFRVHPIFPPDVKAGPYHGALTFTVTYQ